MTAGRQAPVVREIPRQVRNPLGRPDEAPGGEAERDAPCCVTLCHGAKNRDDPAHGLTEYPDHLPGGIKDIATDQDRSHRTAHAISDRLLDA